MLRTRSVFLMIYRPGPAAPRTSPLNSNLATRLLSTSSAPAMSTMSGHEAAKDFVQFVNDSPTRVTPFSPPKLPPVPSLGQL